MLDINVNAYLVYLPPIDISHGVFTPFVSVVSSFPSIEFNALMPSFSARPFITDLVAVDGTSVSIPAFD